MRRKRNVRNPDWLWGYGFRANENSYVGFGLRGCQKDIGRGENRESDGDGPFSGFTGSAAVGDDYRAELRR